MSDIFRQVNINAPDISGYPGPTHSYIALMDSGASISVISEEMAEEMGVDVFAGRARLGGRSYKRARLYITLEGEDCSEQRIDAVVSTRIARKAGPKAQMILGHDYFQKANTIIAYTKDPRHLVSCLSYSKKKRRH